MHHSIPPNHTNPKLLHIRMMISSLILADLGVVAIPQGEANWKFHTVFMAVEVLFTILSRKVWHI
ncbi:unnamed protein product [Brassica rapa subsp. trilocularis]